MRQTCIFTIAVLALFTGCQPSSDVTEPEERSDEVAVETAESTASETGQPVSEVPVRTSDSAPQEPNVPSKSPKPSAVPKEEPAAPEPAKPAAPEPEAPTAAKSPSEPPPRPPKMADLDDSKYGPDPKLVFAANAFPPTLSDTEWHANAWEVNDCSRCHETGVGNAPRVYHKGMAEILLQAKCRSCHVLIPGQSADAVVIKADKEQLFDTNAFPPMLPNSKSHLNSWTADDCMLCHEDGIKGAPVVKHASQHMPRLLLKVKCRTCHVQVRAIETAVALE